MLVYLEYLTSNGFNLWMNQSWHQMASTYGWINPTSYIINLNILLPHFLHIFNLYDNLDPIQQSSKISPKLIQKEFKGIHQQISTQISDKKLWTIPMENVSGCKQYYVHTLSTINLSIQNTGVTWDAIVWIYITAQ